MSNQKYREWIQVEHYRFHLVEDWAESPYKEATLAAIRSSLQSLQSDPSDRMAASECSICRERGTSISASSLENEKPFRLTAVMGGVRIYSDAGRLIRRRAIR